MFFHALVRMRVRRLTTRVSSRRLRDRVGSRRTILCNTGRILEQVAIWLGKKLWRDGFALRCRMVLNKPYFIS